MNNKEVSHDEEWGHFLSPPEDASALWTNIKHKIMLRYKETHQPNRAAVNMSLIQNTAVSVETQEKWAEIGLV